MEFKGYSLGRHVDLTVMEAFQEVIALSRLLDKYRTERKIVLFLVPLWPDGVSSDNLTMFVPDLEALLMSHDSWGLLLLQDYDMNNVF